MSHDALEAIAAQLRSATTFVSVFGVLPEGETKGKKQALKRSFHFLARTVHPDNVPGHEKQANEIFQILNDLHRKAGEAVENGTYDSSFATVLAASFDGIVLQSARDSYRLSATPYREGDFSVIYRALALTRSEEMLIKISKEPVLNNWLEREAVLLTRFQNAPASSPLMTVAKYVPKLVDTFLVEGPGRTRFRVNVTGFVKDLVSAAQIIEAYPHGVEPAQVAWIARRVIAHALAAEMAGVVHGAIVPDHVLVGPVTHEPLHIGWGHAIEDPAKTKGRITHLIDRFRDFYPPEVFEKKAPDSRTDLYMAGKTIIALLGGDVKRDTLPDVVPGEMKRILLRLVEKSPSGRPSDSTLYLDEFTRVVRGIWGRKYRALPMPVQ